MTLSGLRSEIERAGYYPDLVADAIGIAIAGEEIRSYLVHLETTFDRDEVRRHVTVLALTPTRLMIGHTDDTTHALGSPLAPAAAAAGDMQVMTATATTSTEAVALSKVHSVVVSSVVSDPARYRHGQLPQEVTLTLGWGAVSRLDLEPAACDDPGCEADHGYTGSATSDDLTLRISGEAEGMDAVQRVVRFATDLSAATAGLSA